MKIVIAPQTFKGSISALDVAKAMRDGIQMELEDAKVELVPVADGGDGTLETLVEISNGEIKSADVTGPLGEKRTAEWGAMGDGHTAVIEMARTSGLALVPMEPLDRRDPLKATTYGLGEAIKAALDEGHRRFIIGIGGSATNDAGAGMAQALGISLKDAHGNELPYGGAALADLESVDLSGLDPRAQECEIMVACDVNNPLTGPEGASAIFGPQKGATAAMVAQLDDALGNFADVVKRDIGADINDMMGAGAAGGLGGGMVAFLGAELAPGVDIVLDTVEFDKYLEGADLVLTGEGALDSQTVYNKAPIGVARRASQRSIPVIAISGTLGDGYHVVHDHGISAATAIPNAPMTLETASANAAALISDATRQVMRMLKVGGRVLGN
ncbi:MAG: glycerate kinase [SAR202 cluster bacterium]|jgi:glycerate kinase|nr:glycerate kinase [SAR202 cluster bacterium]MDP6714096.1 glycerate kinase [SAR202 cluster bacterium]